MYSRAVGVVFKAIEKETGFDVAVKVMKLNDKQRRELLTEIFIMSQIAHGILSCLTFFFFFFAFLIS